MKKHLKTFCLALLSTIALSSITSAQTGQVIKNLTTGVNDATNALIPYGGVDDTWRVLWPAGSGGGLGYKPAIVCTDLGGTWTTDNCGRWITHKIEAGGYNPDPGGVAGKYVYQTHFELNSSCLQWVKLNFTLLGADNRARIIKVNGHSYTVGSLSWAVQNWFNPLKANVIINLDLSHLVSGTNVIDIEVDNNESYQGLFICGNITQNFCP